MKNCILWLLIIVKIMKNFLVNKGFGWMIFFIIMILSVIFHELIPWVVFIRKLFFISAVLFVFFFMAWVKKS